MKQVRQVRQVQQVLWEMLASPVQQAALREQQDRRVRQENPGKRETQVIQDLREIHLTLRHLDLRDPQEQWESEQPDPPGSQETREIQDPLGPPDLRALD